ncbi:MAG TPA: putative sulfate exporter family transporter [Gemmatimonadaceae bacterium]|nr:putative sulfate exporter family transporter [Gemmatimonadaceae bacterium]
MPVARSFESAVRPGAGPCPRSTAVGFDLRRATRFTALLPGVALCAAIGVASAMIAAVETRLLGHPVIEALVVAILLGVVVRAVWRPAPVTDAGVAFTAGRVLEVAVFLLGASVDLPLLLRAGPALAVGIAVLVAGALAASYGIGRLAGLPHSLAVLVACGNAICGNSAIAAVAPVIDADRDHVASSIAFTAILGVVVILGLPLLVQPLALSMYQYGVLAGVTVYAVPQVLAAAYPVSALSGQVGTMVKLVRVLMLGPVVLFFALTHGRGSSAPGAGVARAARPKAWAMARFVPWFIAGFVALAALRSAGAIPELLIGPARNVSTWLTIAAMAALGLGVDLGAVRRVGPRVILVVTLSLGVLLASGLLLIRIAGVQ